MGMRDEFYAKLDKEYDISKALLKGLVGDYTELVGTENEQEARLCAIAFHDERSGLVGKPVPDEALDTLMKEEKDYKFITDYYLYCNWRVWATYNHNKKLAAEYQKICDTIDGYVFDNWDKDMVSYFVEKTD